MKSKNSLTIGFDENNFGVEIWHHFENGNLYY